MRLTLQRFAICMLEDKRQLLLRYCRGKPVKICTIETDPQVGFSA